MSKKYTHAEYMRALRDGVFEPNQPRVEPKSKRAAKDEVEAAAEPKPKRKPKK